MSTFRILLFAAVLSGCASAPVESLKPPLSELAGCYVDGTESGSDMLLKLKSDMSYEAYVRQTLNIWGHATGTWYYDSSELMFSPSKETEGWHHYMSAVRIGSSNGRLVIAAGSERPLLKSGDYVCGF